MVAPDVSLEVFIDSKWFKAIARGSMIVCCGLMGWVTAQLNGIDGRTDGLEAGVGDLRSTLAARVTDNEEFQRDVSTDLTAIRGAQLVFQGDMVTLKTDIATMRGMLQSIARPTLTVPYVEDWPEVGTQANATEVP